MKVKIHNVRLAFPSLFEAKTVNGEGDPAFSASFLLDPKKNAADIKAVNDAIDAVAADKWGEKGAEIVKGLRKADKVCLHDGDTKSQYDGFDGMQYISARSQKRPLVLDRDKTPLTTADGRPYGGCYVNAVLDIWPQANSYGKRVNAQLAGVQFESDGESFGGGVPASADDFEERETEDDLI